MFFHTVLSYLPYSVVTSVTPGPNNIMALHAVSQQGWRRGKGVVLGMAAGFLCVMVVCALFCYQLDRLLPSVTGVLRYAGAAYILWLAVHVARSQPGGETGQTASFRTGFLLQFLNAKIILYAVTAYTGFVLPTGAGLGALLLHAVVFTAVGTAGFSLWGVAGGLLQRFLARHYRPFNYAMALILVVCAVGML